MKLFEKIKSAKSKIRVGVLMIAIVLAGGFALGGYFIGNGVYQSMAKRTVTVKGLAEKDVVADMAIWNIKISRVGGDLTALQSGVDSDLNKIKSFLKNAGFSVDEIQNLRIQVRDKFAGYSDAELKSQKNEGRYVIETGVMVRSNNVNLIDSVSRRLGELVRQGITITEDYSGPIYIFNGLNDIKISMIEQATKNATDAGRQFAKDANARLGKIQSANQGIFSIESRDPIDQWSNNEKQSINKKVRVVSTITFYLR
ncbi:MAG TPA: SIMPL domain-containing protein [Alphaproteobacteria bacterium]|nr:SIMPL domain-containing protein [Alphaproteobacteria bacterium]